LNAFRRPRRRGGRTWDNASGGKDEKLNKELKNKSERGGHGPRWLRGNGRGSNVEPTVRVGSDGATGCIFSLIVSVCFVSFFSHFVFTLFILLFSLLFIMIFSCFASSLFPHNFSVLSSCLFALFGFTIFFFFLSFFDPAHATQPTAVAIPGSAFSPFPPPPPPPLSGALRRLQPANAMVPGPDAGALEGDPSVLHPPPEMRPTAGKSTPQQA
jgi:hypothetical protein